MIRGVGSIVGLAAGACGKRGVLAKPPSVRGLWFAADSVLFALYSEVDNQSRWRVTLTWVLSAA